MLYKYDVPVDQSFQHIIEQISKQQPPYQQQYQPQHPRSAMYPSMKNQMIPQQMSNYQQQLFQQQQQQQQMRREMERISQQPAQSINQIPIPRSNSFQVPPQQNIQNSQFKPSEMKTETLSFTSGQQNTKYSSATKDLVTKIHYGNRQFVFQISEGKSATKDPADQESNQYSNSQNSHINSQNTQQQDIKLKAEIKFEDIDELEINLTENTINIITRAVVRQFKQQEIQAKKPISWVQHEFIAKEEQRFMRIIAKFPKDVLTKQGSHKNYISHVEKIKSCCSQIRNFNIIGQMPQPSSAENTQNPQPQPMTAQSSQSQLNTQQANNQISFPYKQEEDSQKKMEIYYQNQYQTTQKDKNRESNDYNEDSNLSYPGAPQENWETLFSKVSVEQIQDIKRNYERRNLSHDEKIKKLFDEFKIKQFKTISFNGEKKNLRCPYFKCRKQLNKASSLRNHMKKSHPKLSEIDLNIDDQGIFTWNEKALDYCILLGYIFPQFVKNVIKEMKQRKELPP